LDAWSPATALGYVDMMLELDEQCEHRELSPSILWLSAAGSTQAGPMLGARLLGWNLRVVGVAPFTWPDRTIPALVSDIANQTALLMGVDARIATADVENRTSYIGPGYAVPSDEGLKAMRLAARTDALLLDPVYTAKAMAGLIDQVQTGWINRDDRIIFLHTGGLPAVFAYREAVERMSKTIHSADLS
jgi:1-aminocyclopropane-1-carboxylate deaminase/D-cysteine desulfhydrase-like pyridoxal-dependent ACC family enzyme